jgi:hypothetical protein
VTGDRKKGMSWRALNKNLYKGNPYWVIAREARKIAEIPPAAGPLFQSSTQGKASGKTKARNLRAKTKECAPFISLNSYLTPYLSNNFRVA